MEFYRKYYEAATALGASIVVFHGAFSNFEGDRQEYFERFGTLVQDAKKYGVDLCHENVSRCIGNSPDFFDELSAAIPEAKFVFDVKQSQRAGENILNFAKRMGRRIKHIHFSDHDDSNICLVPGTGVFNIPEFLTVMQNIGYDGGVIVELYAENFKDFVEINDGYQHLYQCISTVMQLSQKNKS